MSTGKTISMKEAARRAGQSQRATAAPAAVDDDLDLENYEPPVLKRTKDDDVERVVLFSLEDDTTGEVREFTIPHKTKFNLAVKVMDVMDKRGEMAANIFMLQQVLGQEAFEALMDYDDLDLDVFSLIAAKAATVVLGNREGKAN